MLRDDKLSKNSHGAPADSNKSSSSPNKGKLVHMEIPFLKNVLVLIGIFSGMYLLTEHVQGYTWLKERFIKGNLEKQEKFTDLKEAEMYEAYFKFNYQFLAFIKENTADTAIVLMPPDSIIMPENAQTAFFTNKRSQSVLNKVWATYFIYPRKLVYQREEGELIGFNRYNYVACIDGWGYDYLNYHVPKKQRAQYQILPRSKDDLERILEEAKNDK